MKTVIELAREAGFMIVHKGEPEIGDWYECFTDEIERLVALARADERNSWPAEMEAMERQVNMLTDALHQERERMKWDVHSCGPDCKRYACASMREAVEAEREACAKVCETLGVHPALNVYNGGPEWYKHGKDCADAIRARGNT